MKDEKLTKRKLKQLCRKSSIEEVISGLDLQFAKHAIHVRNEDLIDIADMVQSHEGPKVDQLKRLLLSPKVHIFHNFTECEIEPKTRIELILIDDIYIVKKLK